MMALVLLWVVLGALWRRWLGGWMGKPPGSRATQFAVMAMLCAPFWLGWAWPSIAAAVLATGLMGWYWSEGHEWTSLPALLKRYGPIGLCWWAAQKWVPPTWRVRTGKTCLIDGPISVAELAAGGLVFGAVGLLWLVPR